MEDQSIIPFAILSVWCIIITFLYLFGKKEEYITKKEYDTISKTVKLKYFTDSKQRRDLIHLAVNQFFLRVKLLGSREKALEKTIDVINH